MTDRCASCTRDCPRIEAEVGPQYADTRILFLGAGPGKHERTRPYCGPAGDEFTDTYLGVAGLRRESVAISNAKLCWDGQDRIPTEKSVLECGRFHLPDMIDRLEPRVVVLMGGVTQRLVTDRHVRLDIHHGRPFCGLILGRSIPGSWIWPMYEPALGMRDGRMMGPLLEDFRHLGQWLTGDWEPPQPDTGDWHDYRIVDSRADLEEYLYSDGGGGDVAYMAVDTESHGDDPWSVQVSVRPHTGVLIRASNRELIRCLGGRPMVFHHAVPDLDVLERFGVQVPSWRDTLQEAFHDGGLPQGLKALTYRLFGVEMRSWEDTVRPASVAAVVEWLNTGIEWAIDNASDTVWSKGRKVKGSEERVGRKSKILPGTIEKTLRHVLKHTVETQDDDKPYDPWEAIPRFWVEGLRGKKAEPWQWAEMSSAIGPMPVLGIGNCDEESAVEYAVGDADWTGRVAVELERRRGSDKWTGVAKEDWDVV